MVIKATGQAKQGSFYDLIDGLDLDSSTKIVVNSENNQTSNKKYFAGGVKILNTIEELATAAKELLGKTLITHQTGPEGKEVKKVYIQEAYDLSLIHI